MFCCLFLKYLVLFPARKRVINVASATTTSAVSVRSGDSIIMDVSTVTTVDRFDMMFGMLWDISCRSVSVSFV